MDLKAEGTVNMSGLVRDIGRLAVRVRRRCRLKAFRRFIDDLKNDYREFSIAGVEIMPLLDSVLLVKEGASCVQVAKLVVCGALEREFPDKDEKEKEIWYELTDFTFQFSGVSILLDELQVLMTLRDGEKLCRGPFYGKDRSGNTVEIRIDLVNDALVLLLDEHPNDAAHEYTSEDINGKTFVPCEGFLEHPNKSDILEWYRNIIQSNEFVDFRNLIEMCKYVKEKKVIDSSKVLEVFGKFHEIQRLIFNAHDIIHYFSVFTSFPDTRIEVLQAQHRAKPIPIKYSTKEIRDLAKQMSQLSIRTLRKLPGPIQKEFSNNKEEYNPPHLSLVSEKHPFKGIGRGDPSKEQLGVILIISRRLDRKVTALQTHFISEYDDALVVSISRQSGILIEKDEKLDLAPYHKQIQTTENEVEVGDVLELYHVAMFIARGSVGLEELMNRAENNLDQAEALFLADLVEIRRKKETVKLSEAVRKFQKEEIINPFALRELICGLAVKGMNIVPSCSTSWLKMQLESELGAEVCEENDDEDGRLIVDIPVKADGILAESDKVIMTTDENRRTPVMRYRYSTNRRGSIRIGEALHGDLFSSRKRKKPSALKALFE